jgi:hypothetical protein
MIYQPVASRPNSPQAALIVGGFLSEKAGELMQQPINPAGHAGQKPSIHSIRPLQRPGLPSNILVDCQEMYPLGF